MNKAGAVIVIVIFVAVLYGMLTLFMPTISGIAETANTSMAASANMTNIPGASEGMLFAPWLLYISPAFIGLIAIFITLRG